MDNVEIELHHHFDAKRKEILFLFEYGRNRYDFKN